jgi:hypothetical protein
MPQVPPASSAAAGTGRSFTRARLWRVAAASAGPVLIVGAVLILLRGFAFGRMISTQNLDTITYFLPNHCFLGASLASGHIPAWNPYTMSGVPFAADPQSGWMYAPAMVLYSFLPCHSALGWFVTLHPILAGIGLWWFLRSEGVGRIGATTGGLALALAMATSRVAVNLPLGGTLAWTMIMLAAASRLLRADRWSTRLGWAGATALAWGQVAGALLTHGTVLATAALLIFVLARLGNDVARDRRGARDGLLVLGLLVALIPAVNLAILLPRLAYLSRTNLGPGYDGLIRLQARLGLGGTRFEVGRSMDQITWPFDLARSPGAYLGGAALSLSFAGLWLRRHRPVAIGFLLFSLICFVLSLEDVARALAPRIGSLPFADVYIHNSARFAYGVLLGLGVLAGLGMEAWVRARSARERVFMVVPGLVVWLVVPALVLGAPGVTPVAPAATVAIVAAGWALAALALAGGAVRPALLLAVPVLMAVELTSAGLVGMGVEQRPSPFAALAAPDLSGAEYTRPGPMVRTVQTRGGRVVDLRTDPDHRNRADARSMIFGTEEVNGYNPTQLLRYWILVREVNNRPVNYNLALFSRPSAPLTNLLQVRWAFGSADEPPGPGWRLEVREGASALYEGPDPLPRASVVAAWTVERSERRLLDLASDAGFDSTKTILLEAAPSFPPTQGVSGTARYRALGNQAAVIAVTTPAPALVLIRNVYDPNWNATLDGRAVPLMRADYLLQAIPVPTGRHTILLEYDDPWIGRGLIATAVALAFLLGAIFLLGRRPAGRRGEPESTDQRETGSDRHR